MSIFSRSKPLPAEIANDGTLMQYAIKGSDEQWTKALDGKEVGESGGTVQIKSVREKRKTVDEQDFEREANSEKSLRNQKGKPNKKKRRGRR